jgi:hypothetical protein
MVEGWNRNAARRKVHDQDVRSQACFHGPRAVRLLPSTPPRYYKTILAGNERGAQREFFICLISSVSFT